MSPVGGGPRVCGVWELGSWVPEHPSGGTKLSEQQPSW